MRSPFFVSTEWNRLFLRGGQASPAATTTTTTTTPASLAGFAAFGTPKPSTNDAGKTMFGGFSFQTPPVIAAPKAAPLEVAPSPAKPANPFGSFSFAAAAAPKADAKPAASDMSMLFSNLAHQVAGKQAFAIDPTKVRC